MTNVRVAGSERRVPNSVQLAAILLIADVTIVVFGIFQALGVGDVSNVGIQVFGTMYVLDTPLFPGVLAALGSLSVVAGFTAVRLRRFQFVLGVALVWSGVALAALPLGPGLLIERVVILLALARGRSAFVD
jgi:hypothetical protein